MNEKKKAAQKELLFLISFKFSLLIGQSKKNPLRRWFS